MGLGRGLFPRPMDPVLPPRLPVESARLPGSLCRLSDDADTFNPFVPVSNCGRSGVDERPRSSRPNGFLLRCDIKILFKMDDDDDIL